MYESFFNFRERPFNLTPDPKYLFLSGRHREAMAHLLYGIRQRSGFILLTGEVGTGKTTLCRALLHSLDEDIEVALIFNPNLSAEELLQTINREFGLPGVSESRKALVDELNAHLLARRGAGKNLVLLVDEAQNLSPPVLEELRLLSNLETETEKLLQIVLIGQPELNDLLKRPELRQLDQRMSVRYHLEPLDQNETGEYVLHRLGVASDHSRAQFTSRAIRALYRYSRGAPRLINVAADRALLVGFTRNRHKVGRGEIRAAIGELSGRREPDGGRRRIGWSAAAAAVLVLAAVGFWPPAREAVIEKIGAPIGAIVARVSPSAASRLEGVAGEQKTRLVRIVTPTTTTILREDDLPVSSAPAAQSPETLFADLGAMEMTRSWSAATNALLERWDAPLVSGGEVAYDFQLAAAQAGLRYASLSILLTDLAALDLPAIVAIDMEGKGARYVALLGYEEDRFITNLDDELWVPAALLEEARRGNVYLFWKDQESLAEIVRAGDKGHDVLWVKNALAELGYYNGSHDDFFDSNLQGAVTALQADFGLEPDGVVGGRTKMVLYSALDAYPTPALADTR